MSPGTIILLNGTSSAGKSTLAQALQKALPEPFLRLGIDTFLAMLPERYFSLEPSTDPAISSWVTHTDAAGPVIEMHLGSVEERALHAMYSAIVALAYAGNNVIFDDVMTKPARRHEAVRVLQALPVCLVGVYCPLAIAEQRERERGDRLIGLARGLFEQVHTDMLYDVVVDTAHQSVEQCVKGVLEALKTIPQPSAIQRLSVRLNSF